MPYLGTQRAKILKNYCHIWKQHPETCHTMNFDIASAFSEGPDPRPLYKVCCPVEECYHDCTLSFHTTPQSTLL